MGTQLGPSSPKPKNTWLLKKNWAQYLKDRPKRNSEWAEHAQPVQAPLACKVIFLTFVYFNRNPPKTTSKVSFPSTNISHEFNPFPTPHKKPYSLPPISGVSTHPLLIWELPIWCFMAEAARRILGLRLVFGLGFLTLSSRRTGWTLSLTPLRRSGVIRDSMARRQTMLLQVNIMWSESILISRGCWRSWMPMA